MFSIARVMRCSIKRLSGNFLPIANHVEIFNLHLDTKILDISKSEKFQNFKQLTHSRGMGTIIKINQEDNRFFIEMNEAVAELKYAVDDGVMEIIHTIVPRKLGGHGLGKLLAKEALEHAVQHDLVLKISCDFVKYYVNEYEPRYLKYILY